jgi:pre-rRNA-processing protein TSR3
MQITYPPTIVVRSPRENPRKCTVIPLKGRADLVFLSFPVAQKPSLESYIRLSAEGEPLSMADLESGILLLDASWRWAERMTASFAEVPARSLCGYRTAYPRVSKQGTDPDNGLASVEALYLAYKILGRQTDGLLDYYRWADQFLRQNALR